ncbi:hypothetical protein Nos7107_3974 [Nostoc sp. PCC 7107]|nr:hypothetical protein Nos7107_3974 [Nostoc sp. PCC 7107]
MTSSSMPYLSQTFFELVLQTVSANFLIFVPASKLDSSMWEFLFVKQ